MTVNAVQDLAAQRIGSEIARLRTRRKWSRTKLVACLYHEIDADDPYVDTFSEAWLKRLENGQMVKLSRRIVEALCRALRCTRQERARILLYSDRNVLIRAYEQPEIAIEMLNDVLDLLADEVYEILTNTLIQHQAVKFTEPELFELTATALELAIKRRRRQFEQQ